MELTIDDATEAYFACSLVFKGETLILGGKRKYNQVSFKIFLTIFIFNSSANLNLADWNQKKICHSQRIYMHKYIAAFIISNVASTKKQPKLHLFAVINNVSRKRSAIFVTNKMSLISQ